MEIRDASTHTAMVVNPEGQATTLAVHIEAQAHTNKHHAQAYIMDIDSVTAGQDADYFIYILNSSDLDMIITSITLWTASDKDDDNVEVWIGHTLTTATNVTAVVPSNLNAGSGLAAAGTFYKSDGTAGGIVTLASGRVCGRNTFRKTGKRWVKGSNWIIPKNQTFALRTEKDNVYRGYISFFYHM